jgi:hypothetical protein
MPSREEEVAWAAGFFEGEGCVTQVGAQFTVALVNTDKDVIDRFDDIVGIGRVYGPYEGDDQDGYKRKRVYRWVASGYDGYDVMQFLAPWLSSRRLGRAFDLTGMRFPVPSLPM